MKLLRDIVYRAGIIEIQGSGNIAIEHICMDSRKVSKFSLFIAVRGTQVDGHDFIDTAIEKGAVAIVCEKLPTQLVENITYVLVQDAAVALGQIAANFYDHPSKKLKLVGVTGTNGKTTVASLSYELFTKMGFSCGLLSTIQNKIRGEVMPATHTTPDAISLNALLHEMVKKGCTHAFMEVSSHALVQKRVEGVQFYGAVFTNITHDHLDYHGTFRNYLDAKKILFDQLSEEAFALVNNDDKHADYLLQNTEAKKCTYSLKSVSTYKARIVENQIQGLVLNIDGTEVWTQLIGEFNAYNLLAVYAIGVLLKQDKMNVLTTLSTLKSVEGRFQIVRGVRGITAIVDYAHTPDALENVLSTIRNIVENDQKVITVVGCGGNRDKEKRPVMAKVAANYSDRVILTSDNPRNEEPQTILNEMKAGLDTKDLLKSMSILDRREAILTACSLAGENDVILIAGKGHEKYQEVNGERTHFDDIEEVTIAFNLLKTQMN